MRILGVFGILKGGVHASMQRHLLERIKLSVGGAGMRSNSMRLEQTLLGLSFVELCHSIQLKKTMPIVLILWATMNRQFNEGICNQE
jgi:hypothetical protein